MNVEKIILYYPRPLEIKEEFLPELETIGLTYNGETKAFEIKDWSKSPLMFTVIVGLYNIKTVEELRVWLSTVVEKIRMGQK